MLAVGRWMLDVGVRWTFLCWTFGVRYMLNTLDVGRWTLDVRTFEPSEHWALDHDVGRRTLDVGRSDVHR